MNANLARSAILATLLLGATLAAPAAADTSARAPRLVVDCAHPATPTFAEVAAWSGTNNSTRVYEAWTRTRTQFHRACRQAPGAQVELVFERRSGAPMARGLASASR
jgi:hypothetical protein